jgi:hypothetical protein
MNIDDLRREIDASRRAIRHDYASLRTELDFATKAKKAVTERPLPWLGGAALFGYLLSGRRKRKALKSKTGKPETARRFTLLGLLLGAARLIFPLVRPQLTSFALGKLAGYAGKSPR